MFILQKQSFIKKNRFQPKHPFLGKTPAPRANWVFITQTNPDLGNNFFTLSIAIHISLLHYNKEET